MGILRNVANVRVAALEARGARLAVGVPASSLLARGRKYPLTTVGSAAGAGFVLGSLNVHPLRVPGLGALLSGGMAEAVAFGTKLIAELGVAGLGAAVRDAAVDRDDAQP